MRSAVLIGILLSLPGGTFAASIAGSRASTDRVTATLEGRSKRELKRAKRALRSARLAYRAGNKASFVASMLAIEDRIDRVYELLVQTGENPREMPEYFKQAEIEIRQLYRRLEFFGTEISNGDSELVENVKARAQEIQHDLLSGIASGTRVVGVYPDY